eukprot:493476-Pyramimonas_sp.AAC.1
MGPRAGYILPPLLRYCLPSCVWFSRWVYTASPPAIGSHAGWCVCGGQQHSGGQPLCGPAQGGGQGGEAG